MTVRLIVDGDEHVVEDGSTVRVQEGVVEVSTVLRILSKREVEKLLAPEVPVFLSRAEEEFLWSFPPIRFSSDKARAKYEPMVPVVWDTLDGGNWYPTKDIASVVMAMCCPTRPWSEVMNETGYLLERMSREYPGHVQWAPVSDKSSGNPGSPRKYRRLK